ncbi:MAG TPA: (2Fe-2S) ferredoxin domain-containing protein [Spirochaetales bacterium]|nr:(2Fe-2S) ferredoxin domain-containing protein [Spirochaetales bacterium]HOV37172.1 (2Fe-2S) ferredoxin domain-containing protein [Spirochaetales bacterium]
MAKMTLEELKKLRETKKRELEKRETAGKDIEIIVGMATCGIAAGAKNTLSAFLNELEAQNLSNVLVRQTGCMGYCYAEPTVEIRMPGMPNIIYGKVDPETAVKIVRKHILGKALINDHILDKPAADIIKK